MFGRSPFVPEFTHHQRPSDPATDEAFDALTDRVRHDRHL